MTKNELEKWLFNKIINLPTDFSKVYDAVTLEEGIMDCFDAGRRKAYIDIYEKLTGKPFTISDKRSEILSGRRGRGRC